MADADPIGGVIVFKQGEATVVADAAVRRDARTRSKEPAASAARTGMEGVFSQPDHDDEGPKRPN